MNIAYFNGTFLPKDKIRISPDDRGFLFGDGIYEVMKWYGGFFFDPESHLARLKRSLREVRINWPEADTFPSIARELIKINKLEDRQALIYLQVTRGAAPRNHLSLIRKCSLQFMLLQGKQVRPIQNPGQGLR